MDNIIYGTYKFQSDFTAWFSLKKENVQHITVCNIWMKHAFYALTSTMSQGRCKTGGQQSSLSTSKAGLGEGLCIEGTIFYYYYCITTNNMQNDIILSQQMVGTFL